MVFSSLSFLQLFLPLTLLAYYAAPRPARNVVALLASLTFYAWGAPRFVFVLVALSIVDYVLAPHLVPGCVPRHVRRLRLSFGIAANVILLLYFKYMNFLVAQLDALLNLFSLPSPSWAQVALPIGISFFTFQKLSYLIDVYRGVAHPARKFTDYLLYVSLFPQLIAGPIVRYHDIADQLVRRNFSSERFLSGWWRFCFGFARKVLIANTAGAAANRAFDADPSLLGPAAAWLGVFCYAVQIYFDFSGYSDMAIGLGRMLGFEFLENFRFPYIASSFTEFWRRWHISLGSWMREYLYVPLGGNRVAPARRALNLWLVFLISGLWHGASWNFVIWGAYHGCFLSLEKRFLTRLKSPPPRWLAVPLTFALVLIGWVFFRCETLPQAGAYLGAMFGAHPAAPAVARALAETCTDGRLLLALVSGMGIALAPLFGLDRLLREQEGRWMPSHKPLAADIVRTMAATVLLLVSMTVLVNSDFNPFIYYRF